MKKFLILSCAAALSLLALSCGSTSSSSDGTAATSADVQAVRTVLSPTLEFIGTAYYKYASSNGTTLASDVVVYVIGDSGLGTEFTLDSSDVTTDNDFGSITFKSGSSSTHYSGTANFPNGFYLDDRLFDGDFTFDYDTGTEPKDDIYSCTINGEIYYGGTYYDADLTASINGSSYACTGTWSADGEEVTLKGTYTLPTETQIGYMSTVFSTFDSKVSAAITAAGATVVVAVPATATAVTSTSSNTWYYADAAWYSSEVSGWTWKVVLATGYTATSWSATVTAQDSGTFVVTDAAVTHSEASGSPVMTLKASDLLYSDIFLSSDIDAKRTAQVETTGESTSSVRTSTTVITGYTFSGAWAETVDSVVTSWKLAGLTCLAAN